MNMQTDNSGIAESISERLEGNLISQEIGRDGTPTLWVNRDNCLPVLHHLRSEGEQTFPMLYDLTAIDERHRRHGDGRPEADFTVVYHLLSLDPVRQVRVKVPLSGNSLSLPSITGIWPAANWYEREVYDMFGIGFDNHPHLTRIIMPLTWQGHPLRKDHHARATEVDPYSLARSLDEREHDSLQFKPEDWGMERRRGSDEFIFLNLGPQHPGTHGVLRLVVQLDGEVIIDVVPEIGYHHRGAEKMAERQTWHTFIPYTDRIDYLAGVANNLSYVLAVEKLAGIEVPDRAKVIRVMLTEMFRIASHLVWYGTFAQDVGSLSPVFYMFNDRERLFRIVEAICGDRMHPNWFRIGGVAQDLPNGWERLVSEFVDYLPKRLQEYDTLVMKNAIFKARTIGVGAYDTATAIEWGVTGPGLRATGLDFDFRKGSPYSGYEQFEFEIPTATGGDCYDRAVVRIEEMRQSLRIIKQCLDNMPSGDYKSRHPASTPPIKPRTMEDIETLINHFLNVSWGPVIPAGEACVTTEAPKGGTAYYLVSDHDTSPYRARIRAPSFPHIQMTPVISRGETVADLMAILGSIDFVLADVDR